MPPDALWASLSAEERQVLDRLLGGGHSPMTVDIADRLVALGLVERLLGTFALTRAGRDLVLRHFNWQGP